MFIFKLSLPVFLFAIVQKHLSRVRFKSVEQILQHKGCRVRDCLIVQFVFAFFFIKLGVSFVFVLFCFFNLRRAPRAAHLSVILICQISLDS